MSSGRQCHHNPLPFADLRRELVANLLVNKETADLVDAFASILLLKLAKAERKHGYGLEWMDPSNIVDLVRQAELHVLKGDPRDVAAYAAFLWWHNVSMSPPKRPRRRKARVG